MPYILKQLLILAVVILAINAVYWWKNRGDDGEHDERGGGD